MHALIELFGVLLRVPFWLVGVAVAAVSTLVFVILSALWFFVGLPVLWVLFGVPLAVASALFSGRRDTTRRLGGRLKHDVRSWQGTWHYHFREVFEPFRSLNRWLRRGTVRRW